MKYLELLVLVVLNYSNIIADEFWKPANGPIASSNVSEIVVDSRNNLFVTNGTEIFKSTNSGDEWIKIDNTFNSPLSHSVYRIMIDNNDNLYSFNYQNFTAYNKDLKSQFYINSKIYPDNIEICGRNIFSYSDDILYYASLDSLKPFYDALPSREFDSIYYREEVSYDCNFGIVLTMIDFDYYNYFTEDFKLYNSTDLGNTWSELYFIPGTDIDFKNVRIFNDYLWLINRDSTGWREKIELYNIHTKTLNENLPFEKVHIDSRFYSFKDNLYFVDGYSLFHSSDGGMNWNKISEHIFGYPEYDWIDAFAVDSNGVLYAGTRYQKLMKSTDNGINWSKINLNTETEFGFKNIKNFDSIIYAYDNENIYQSENKGENWKSIPFNDSKYKISCDFNSKGEIVYIQNGDIFYSKDNGLNWMLADSALKNKSKDQNGLKKELEHIEITDDGRIFINSTFLAESYKDTFNLTNYFGASIKLVEDNKYHSQINNGLALLDTNLQLIDYVFQFPDSIRFDHYTKIDDSTYFIATNSGLFKHIISNDTTELIYVYNQYESSKIYSDGNKFLYLFLNDDIYYSKDFGETFFKISSNLNNFLRSSTIAFGNGRLIGKKDKMYFADIDEKDFLNVNIEYQNDTIYYGQKWDCKFKVTNQYNERIESANVYIANSITNQLDTLVTDNNGEVTYSFIQNLNVYKVNYQIYLNRFDLYYFTDKDGCYKSNTEYLQVNLKADKLEFWIENKYNKYYNCNIDTTVKYFLKIAYKDNITETGKIIIENFLTNKTDTIDHYGSDYSVYNFKINPDAKPGMYKLKFTGINENGEKTTDYTTYIIISSKPLSEIKQFYNSSNNYTLFPNPASDYIEIKLSESYQIKIYNTYGQCVIAVETGLRPVSTKRIDVSGLPVGMYFVRIGSEVKKFVKF